MLGCCGAICDWAGRYEMQESTREFLLTELSKLGDPVIIAGCPSCRKELAESIGGEIVGIWDILEQIGLPEGAKGMDRPAALHDSCGARGDAHTQETIRNLASRLGVKLVETEYSGDRSPCCGYGGLTAYANPEVAGEITRKALERTDAPYITYCMACRDRFAREGRESRHILELIYGTDMDLKGDVFVLPVGLIGRIMRVQRDQSRMQLFNMIVTNQFLLQLIGPKGVLALLRPSLKDLDVNPDDILPSESRLKFMEAIEELKQLANAEAQAPQGAGQAEAGIEQNGAPPGVAQPPQVEMPQGGVAERRAVA
jgi:hypothetical protein